MRLLEKQTHGTYKKRKRKIEYVAWVFLVKEFETKF